ncbi:MAG: chloride channel protein, partial [Paracoccaceae bacterium]
VTEFRLSTHSELEFYLELPAFLLLGLVCGVVAVVLMRAIFWADDLGTQLQRAMRLPHWLCPAVAGVMLGGLAIGFPHVI